MRTKAILIAGLMLVLGLGATAQAQDMPPRADDADRPSKNGSTKGTIDGVDITITYGRPNVKGRIVWGGLVGYGSVWRAGANEATVISFSKNVTVNGEALSAGVYSFFTIPTEAEWTLIFNKTPKLWGTAYATIAENDALRVKVTPSDYEHIEELDYIVEGDKVLLRWEKLAVGFTVAAAN